MSVNNVSLSCVLAMVGLAACSSSPRVGPSGLDAGTTPDGGDAPDADEPGDDAQEVGAEAAYWDPIWIDTPQLPSNVGDTALFDWRAAELPALNAFDEKFW
jgi:hypothetical protein